MVEIRAAAQLMSGGGWGLFIYLFVGFGGVVCARVCSEESEAAKRKQNAKQKKN